MYFEQRQANVAFKHCVERVKCMDNYIKAREKETDCNQMDMLAHHFESRNTDLVSMRKDLWRVVEKK